MRIIRLSLSKRAIADTVNAMAYRIITASAAFSSLVIFLCIYDPLSVCRQSGVRSLGVTDCPVAVWVLSEAIAGSAALDLICLPMISDTSETVIKAE